jgi:hypothetical protein
MRSDSVVDDAKVGILKAVDTQSWSKEGRQQEAGILHER